ncbi:MAG: tetratricopeptide repeat protein, partial [Myxococcales bacterium]|nr:tetratricopeptide repeat protein [Myxococcales bacterium]
MPNAPAPIVHTGLADLDPAEGESTGVFAGRLRLALVASVFDEDEEDGPTEIHLRRPGARSSLAQALTEPSAATLVAELAPARGSSRSLVRGAAVDKARFEPATEPGHAGSSRAAATADGEVSRRVGGGETWAAAGDGCEPAREAPGDAASASAGGEVMDRDGGALADGGVGEEASLASLGDDVASAVGAAIEALVGELDGAIASDAELVIDAASPRASALLRADEIDARALAFAARGLLERAERHHLMALALRERCSDEVHPDCVLSYNRLAALCLRRRDRVGAASWLELASQVIRERAVARDARAMTLHNYAALSHAQGRLTRALAQYTEALTLKREHYGALHWSVGLTLGNLGNLRRSLGEHDEALECYAEALTVFEHCGEPARGDAAWILGCAGRAHASVGDMAAAAACFEQATEIYEHAARDQVRARASVRFFLARAVAD